MGAARRLGGGHGLRHAGRVRQPQVGDPGSHFGSPLNEFPVTETKVYIGFTALVLNLLVTVVLTVVLRALGVDEGVDQTSPEDYRADVGDEGVEPELDPEVAPH